MPSRRSATPEGAVLSACFDYLTVACRFYCWRNNSGVLPDRTGRPVRFGLVGSSDILGILPGGKFLAVECKAGRGKTTPAQDAFLAGVREAGGVALVVRSIDDLRAGLRGAGFDAP